MHCWLHCDCLEWWDAKSRIDIDTVLTFEQQSSIFFIYKFGFESIFGSWVCGVDLVHASARCQLWVWRPQRKESKAVLRWEVKESLWFTWQREKAAFWWYLAKTLQFPCITEVSDSRSGYPGDHVRSTLCVCKVSWPVSRVGVIIIEQNLKEMLLGARREILDLTSQGLS